jgi:hypothetical protein
MRTLLTMIGARFMLNAFLVVVGASVVIGLMISGMILMLP